MKNKIAVCGALVLAILGGVAAENRLDVVGRVFPPDQSEFRSISKFVATQQFGEAREFIRNDLVTDAMPIAEEARSRLDNMVLDANGLDETVVEFLVDIAGVPESPKDGFMLQSVYACLMFGAKYGQFAALRDGVFEPSEVNELVTRCAVDAIDGLLDFLSELPRPDPPLPPVTPDGPPGDSGQKQLDEWADDLEP